MNRDPRVDAYIDGRADFAKPILEYLRDAVHRACPEAEETLKWSSPTFLYKGEMLASMAAFKEHAAFSFWRGSLVTGKTGAETSAMGQFGRLTSPADLPPADILDGLIRRAMQLTDDGVKPPRTKTGRPKPPPEVPDDLRTALGANTAAAATFAGFSPSARREYVDWLTEAKRPETRAKRLAQAVEWMAEGKKRHWKYENC